jgi:hypothetical protein
MLKNTLRKRVAVIAATALATGVLAVGAIPASATHPLAGSGNANANTVAVVPNTSLFVATAPNPTTLPAAATTTIGTAALSKGLLSKDTSSGTAQTAVVLPGGTLSLYANVSTAVTFSATGGSFSSVAVVTTATAGGAVVAVTPTYNNNNSKAWVPILFSNVAIAAGGNNDYATGVAALWTAPTTVGVYTVSMSRGFAAQSDGRSLIPSTDNGDSPTLTGQITVSVVASSAGGTYSAAYSACRTTVSTAGYNALSTVNAAVDSTGSVKNGDAWSIDFDLNDAYAADLPAGNILVSATNGALVALGTAGATPVAGTGSTIVSASSPSGAGFANTGRTVRVDQGTAGAPVTTTVTISFNGTTVCTKTVTISGKVDNLTVANVGTQNLSTTAGSSQWMYQEIGLYSPGLFTILAKDSAGNIIDVDGLGTFSADAATLTTVVQGITTPTLASSRSSTSTSRFTLGSWGCGAVAGSASIKVKFTTTGTGATVTSPAFTARCAGVPDTYTVAMDKAAYKQGDIATVTVQFTDSKGNKANSVTAVGANTWVLPYVNPVTFTGTGASATAVSKADGSVAYTFTVGTTTAVVNGSYAGVVTYDAPANGVKQTPTYTLSTGGDTTSNADVLKSIVALIASINKQIQALQKLILKR